MPIDGFSLKSFSKLAVRIWQAPYIGGLGLIDILLIATSLLLFASEQILPLLHIIFIWLSIGAFFWEKKAFAAHSVFWVGLSTIRVYSAISTGVLNSDALSEIPLLSIILLVVYIIAHWRNQAQAALDDANRELAEANDRLTELDSLKNKFMADIAHELRTPLTNLTLYVDLLKGGKQENQARYLSVIKRQSKQLVQIIEDIIGVSTLVLSRGNWQLQAIELNGMVRTVLDGFQDQVPEGGPRLVFDSEPNLASVLGEREHLELAITKLIDNAIKYTPSGLVRVTTWNQPEDNCAGLEIADTGIGISEEELPHIFERLYRGNNVGQFNIPGSGLGLTLARELILLHNGFIDLESDEGHGTRVRVLLPSAAPDANRTDETIVIRADESRVRPL